MGMDCAWFRPVDSEGRYSADMPPFGISGVYAIASLEGVALYVGESHTGQLRKTMQRHLQIWNDRAGPRATYSRHRVQVCWIETSDSEALDLETEWMDALQPRDNLLVPEYDDSESEYSPAADDSGVPF